MYRAKLERQKMTAEVLDNQDHFLNRVGSLPVVTTALSQLGNLYTHTKEKNRLLKYALETTESGVKLVANTAVPIVHKFDKPIGTLNQFACHQLDKLEETYPIITQPTEKVMAQSKELYDSTLKPTVDKVTAVKDMGSEKINNLTSYTTDKIDGVKQYTVSTVDGVRHFTFTTVNGVIQFTVSTVGGVRQYSVSKLEGLMDYSTNKVNMALDNPYGKALVNKLDNLLLLTDQYVDHYLPEDEKDPDQNEDVVKTSEASTDEPAPLTRVANIGSKVRRRTYARAMKDLSNIHLRSKETLEKLTFTVDLIQYAKTNVDNVQGKLTEMGSKAKWLWDEINREEEDLEMEYNSEEKGLNTNMEEKVTLENLTLERRLISTSRHLTLSLKKGFQTLTDMAYYLPSTFHTQFDNAKKYTEQIYIDLASARSLDDLKFLDQIKGQINYMQDTLSSVTDYVTTACSDWLERDRQSSDSDEDSNIEEDEDAAMETGP
jgi:perilipin-2